MSMATIPERIDVDPGRIHRLSLDVYHAMAEHGLITEADRVVLLDGLLMTKMTRNPPHVATVQAGLEALSSILPAGWYVRKEDPILLPGGPRGDSEPEPDLAVVRGDRIAYKRRHPGPGDVTLIVEVADSSLAEDRKALGRYAWAGIPVVWIVNLANESVEVYAEPSGACQAPGYARSEVKKAGDRLDVVLDGELRGTIPAGRILS